MIWWRCCCVCYFGNIGGWHGPTTLGYGDLTRESNAGENIRAFEVIEMPNNRSELPNNKSKW